MKRAVRRGEGGKALRVLGDGLDVADAQAVPSLQEPLAIAQDGGRVAGIGALNVEHVPNAVNVQGDHRLLRRDGEAGNGLNRVVEQVAHHSAQVKVAQRRVFQAAQVVLEFNAAVAHLQFLHGQLRIQRQAAGGEDGKDVAVRLL